MEDGRKLVLDDRPVALVLHELREHLFPAALRLLLRDPLQASLAQLGGKAGHQLFGAQRAVPQLQRLQLAELGHRLPVRADAGGGHVLGVGVLEAAVPACHREAGGEALDVPLPRGGQRLVQVVDGENHPALGSRESAEIAQVRVAAALDPQARGRRRRQVGRHRERRPAVERERGADHAPVPQREQLAQAPLLRRQHEFNRVAAVGRRLPDGMPFPRAAGPQGLARGVLFLPRWALAFDTRRLGAGVCFVEEVAGRLREITAMMRVLPADPITVPGRQPPAASQP